MVLSHTCPDRRDPCSIAPASGVCRPTECTEGLFGTAHFERCVFSARPLSPNFWFPHDMPVVVNNLSDQERLQKSGGNDKIQHLQKDL
jgi:hypothetical protein